MLRQKQLRRSQPRLTRPSHLDDGGQLPCGRVEVIPERLRILAVRGLLPVPQGTQKPPVLGLDEVRNLQNVSNLNRFRTSKLTGLHFSFWRVQYTHFLEESFGKE